MVIHICKLSTYTAKSMVETRAIPPHRTLGAALAYHVMTKRSCLKQCGRLEPTLKDVSDLQMNAAVSRRHVSGKTQTENRWKRSLQRESGGETKEWHLLLMPDRAKFQ